MLLPSQFDETPSSTTVLYSAAVPYATLESSIETAVSSVLQITTKSPLSSYRMKNITDVIDVYGKTLDSEIENHSIVAAKVETTTSTTSTTSSASVPTTAVTLRTVSTSFRSAAKHEEMLSTEKVDEDQVLFTQVIFNGAEMLSFSSFDDFVHSTIFKLLRKGRQYTPIGFHIKKGNKAYLYAPEKKEKRSENEADFEGEAASWLPWKKEKPVKFLEVDYGKSNSYLLKDFPISTCVLSAFGEGGSYGVSNVVTRKLSISYAPAFSVFLGLVTARVQTGISSSSIDLSNSGGITCTIPPGGQVQVFADLPFVSFPKARTRDVEIKNKEIASEGKWALMKPTIKERPNLGALLFDLAEFPSPKCVDNPAKLTCSINASKVGDPYEAALLL